MVGNRDLTRLINPTELDRIGNLSSKLSGHCLLGVATTLFSPENLREFNLRKKVLLSFFMCPLHVDWAMPVCPFPLT